MGFEVTQVNDAEIESAHAKMLCAFKGLLHLLSSILFETWYVHQIKACLIIPTTFIKNVMTQTFYLCLL